MNKEQNTYVKIDPTYYVEFLQLCKKLNKTREETLVVAINLLSQKVDLEEGGSVGVLSLKEHLDRIESRIEDIFNEL